MRRSTDLFWGTCLLQAGHAAVTDDHHRIETKVIAQPINLEHQRAGIGGIALSEPRPPPGRRAQQTVVHLPLALLAVAIVVEFGRGQVAPSK